MKKFYFMALALMSSASSFAQLAEGSYYIQNVESGKYISNGANWGTRSVLADNGICYNVVVTDGKYTLKSGIKGDSKALRPSDGFNDQSGEWELVATEGGYYMYNGEKYFTFVEGNDLPQFAEEATSAAVWKFVSPAELKASLDAASKSNPVDATFLIKGADFLNGDEANKAWSLTKVGGDNGSVNTLVNNTNCEQWNGTDGVNFDINQTVTEIPNGIYQLQAFGYTRQAGATTASADAYEDGSYTRAYLYANEVETELPSVFSESNTGFSAVTSTAGNAYNIPNSQAHAAAAFSEGKYLTDVIEVEVTDGTLKVGVKCQGPEWVVFDNFRLTYLGMPDNTIAAGKYAVKANVALADGVTIDMVPAAFKDYVGEYTTTATLAGDESSLIISENAEEGLFNGFEIVGNRVALSADKTITLGGKVFTVRTANEAETGSLAITATEDGYTMESASVYYNGKKVATVSNITIAAVEPAIALSNMSLTIADGETLDEDGCLKVVFNYDAEILDEAAAIMGHVEAVIYVYDENGNELSWSPWDIKLDGSFRNIYVDGLELGKSYTFKIGKVEGGVFSLETFTDEPMEIAIDELPTITYTIPAPAPEVAGLSKDIFKKYYSNATGEKLETPEAIGCDYGVGVSTGMVYGLSTVKWYAYADVTDYDYMALYVTEGTPRVMYNREIDPAKTPEDDGVNHVEITASSPFLQVLDYDATTKVYIYDLKAMAAADPAKPFVHINAIKGANWANTTITQMDLVKGANPATSISAVATPAAEATIEAIYSANGAKLATMQKGLNIVRYSNGATKKIMVK